MKLGYSGDCFSLSGAGRRVSSTCEQPGLKTLKPEGLTRLARANFSQAVLNHYFLSQYIWRVPPFADKGATIN